MLKVEGESKHFGGVYANRDVSLEVAEGELRGVIGPNGAGKSTLFNLIAGHLRPDAGSISLAGAHIDRLPPHVRARRGVAIVFQGARLFAGMSLLQNVMVGAHAHSRAGLVSAAFRPPAQRREEREIRAQAEQCLDRVGLLELADRPAEGLPLGQQRRLQVARALAGRPGCCFSTSRPPACARRSAPSSPTSSARSTPRARPSSSSSTTSGWSPRWPIASRCWTSAR